MRTVARSIRESVDYAGNHILPLLLDTRMGGFYSNVSQTIFQISPANKWRLFSDCWYGYVSRWALDVFLEQFMTHGADAIAAFYRTIPTLPMAGSLRRYLLEKQALNHCIQVSDRQLTKSNRMTWNYRGPIKCLDSPKSEFPEAITEAVGE